jgi:hypothetical protein
VAQPGHWTLPLPQAFGTVPQAEPAHSGGAWLQTPPMHCRPVGHAQFIVFPQESATLPQRCVLVSGVQLSGPQDADASTLIWGTHALLALHAWPVGQPPQLIGTPQGSTPTTPHRPVHDLAWHDWEPPEPAQTWLPEHALPQTKALPVHGST